jgi:two-component system NarL family sensor kinase
MRFMVVSSNQSVQTDIPHTHVRSGNTSGGRRVVLMASRALTSAKLRRSNCVELRRPMMKLRQKYLLLAVAPLVLAMLAIALAVLHQANALARRQRALVEAAYLQSKEAELHHYVDLVQSAITPRVQSGHNDDATRQAAMQTLARLDFGPDGYVFLYDLQGHALLHPRQPELVGHDLSQMRDAQGQLTIQQLLAAAHCGGGTVPYWWRKPSTGQTMPKLGYVNAIPQWNWMVGTGLYLDDVDRALQ